jgi:hypothetical protein
MDIAEFGIDTNVYNVASPVDQRDMLVNAKARLDAHVSSLRAETTQSRGRFLNGDPRALGRTAYHQRLSDLDEARAKVARLQIELTRLHGLLKRENIALRERPANFERAFMATAKRVLGADQYGRLIDETKAVFGDQQAA